jgi:hypothetical protein
VVGSYLACLNRNKRKNSNPYHQTPKNFHIVGRHLHCQCEYKLTKERGWTFLKTEHKIQPQTQDWVTSDFLSADRDDKGTWLCHICLEAPDNLVLNLWCITQLNYIIYIVSVLNNNYLLPRNRQNINRTLYISYSQCNIDIAIFRNGMPNSLILCYILYLCLYLECIKKYKWKFELRKVYDTQLNYE